MRTELAERALPPALLRDGKAGPLALPFSVFASRYQGDTNPNPLKVINAKAETMTTPAVA